MPNDYILELEEFTKKYGGSNFEDRAELIESEEEDENVESLGDEYKYDTRRYREEFDLDKDGNIVDHDAKFEGNAAAQEELRALIPFGGTYQSDLQKFLDKLGIRFFSAAEIMQAKGGSHYSSGSMCYNKNSLAPRSKWRYFARTIVALDAIRADLGYPIFLIVAYRSKPYNECLIEQSKKNNGGISGVAKYSQHLNFNAIDFRGQSGSSHDWGKAVRRYKQSQDPKVWTKTYSSFVHIDTRGNML